jgi:alkylated DNA repair dioxygenase AlkB
MTQMPLFEGAGRTVLVDDGHGCITYTPGILPPEVAAAWFAEVRDSVPWQAQQRRMYDRDVDVPRLTAHFRLDGDDGDPPGPIRLAASEVVAATGVPFNSVGLNLYRDGHDSVAPHGDHLDEIVPGFPIALLSLGATRRMTIRARGFDARAFHVELAAGSLLVMSHETQRHYTHGIPKTRDAVGPRISLAFRVKPARARSEGTGVYR